MTSCVHVCLNINAPAKHHGFLDWNSSKFSYTYIYAELYHSGVLRQGLHLEGVNDDEAAGWGSRLDSWVGKILG